MSLISIVVVVLFLAFIFALVIAFDKFQKKRIHSEIKSIIHEYGYCLPESESNSVQLLQKKLTSSLMFNRGTAIKINEVLAKDSDGAILATGLWSNKRLGVGIFFEKIELDIGRLELVRHFHYSEKMQDLKYFVNDTVSEKYLLRGNVSKENFNKHLIQLERVLETKKITYFEIFKNGFFIFSLLDEYDNPKQAVEHLIVLYRSLR